MERMTSELLRRRVPQFVGLYLAGSWALVEFLDWAVEQFVLSPHITSFVFLLLLLLLPSVVTLAWRHGAPGRDGWGRVEAIGIPLNLVLAAGVLFAGFYGKNLGAATTTITVEDEAGQEVERQVAKEAFRRKLAVFYFENESGDRALDWMSFASTLALDLDLAQQLFVVSASPLDSGDSGSILQDLEEAGFEGGLGAPLALKREIAERRRLDHFVVGSFDTEGDEIVLSTRLYETRRGRPVAERTFRGDDLMALMDTASEQLRRDLGVPELRLSESPDLPVAELLTTSETALAEAAQGFHVMARGRYGDALPYLKRAVGEDPTFALAQAQLSIVQLLSNRRAEAEAAMAAAAQHLYRLPERIQFSVRAIDFWLLRQDPERAFQTTRYWAELYPDDVQAHAMLAQMYSYRNERGPAIVELELARELDPTRWDLVEQLGNLHSDGGDFDLALEQYARYAEVQSGDYRPHAAMASTHRWQGEHAKARASYDRAQVMEPDESSIYVARARHEMDVGDFEQAATFRDRALSTSKSHEDRYAVFSFDETLHYRQGRFEDLERDYEARRSEAEAFMDPLNLAISLAASELIVFAPEAGRQEDALRKLDAIGESVQPPFDGFMANAYLRIFLSLGNVEGARREIERIEGLIEALGMQAMRPTVATGLGRIAEIEGDCGGAIASYEEALGIAPNLNRARLGLARCRLKEGDPEAAQAEIERVLRAVPAHPAALNQLALVHEQTGRVDDAVATLRKLLEIWKDADPGYIPARDARARLAELEGAA